MPRSRNQIRDEGIARFNELATPKYDKGQAEHGGLLDETVTFDKLEEEILDMWFYAQSLRQKAAALDLSCPHCDVELLVTLKHNCQDPECPADK